MNVDSMNRLLTALRLAAVSAEAALDAYPPDAQEWMMIEEASELLTAMARVRRGRASGNEVIYECADVIICAIQMGIMHADASSSDALADIIEYKSQRLLDRITKLTQP